MALRMINLARLLLIVAALVVMVMASVTVARESLIVGSPVKQDSANWEEVSHKDYEYWSPPPIVRKGRLAPVPHDYAPPRPRKMKA